MTPVCRVRVIGRGVAAVRSVHPEDFSHHDPADRLIVATALGLGATVVTADTRLRRYKPLATLWD